MTKIRDQIGHGSPNRKSVATHANDQHGHSGTATKKPGDRIAGLFKGSRAAIS